jgi:hypothetical protein
MKKILVSALLILAAVGCSTIASRPLLTVIPESVTLRTDWRIMSFMSDSEYVDLPAGEYKRRFQGQSFQEQSGYYFMRDELKVTQKTLFPAKVCDGGIFYSTHNGRWYSFTFLKDMGSLWVGTFSLQLGDPSKYIPVVAGLIPDERVNEWKLSVDQ